jgi:hypothetical protein
MFFRGTSFSYPITIYDTSYCDKTSVAYSSCKENIVELDSQKIEIPTSDILSQIPMTGELSYEYKCRSFRDLSIELQIDSLPYPIAKGKHIIRYFTTSSGVKIKFHVSTDIKNYLQNDCLLKIISDRVIPEVNTLKWYYLSVSEQIDTFLLSQTIISNISNVNELKETLIGENSILNSIISSLNRRISLLSESHRKIIERDLNKLINLQNQVSNIVNTCNAENCEELENLMHIFHSRIDEKKQAISQLQVYLELELIRLNDRHEIIKEIQTLINEIQFFLEDL